MNRDLFLSSSTPYSNIFIHFRFHPLVTFSFLTLIEFIEPTLFFFTPPHASTTTSTSTTSTTTMKYSSAITTALASLLCLPSTLLAQVTIFRDIDFSGPSERLTFTPEVCSTYFVLLTFSSLFSSLLGVGRGHFPYRTRKHPDDKTVFD